MLMVAVEVVAVIVAVVVVVTEIIPVVVLVEVEALVWAGAVIKMLLDVLNIGEWADVVVDAWADVVVIA